MKWVRYFGLAACVVILTVMYFNPEDTKQRSAVDCIESAEQSIRVQIYMTERALQGDSPTVRTDDLVLLRRALGTVMVFEKTAAEPTAADCDVLSRKIGVYVLAGEG